MSSRQAEILISSVVKTRTRWICLYLTVVELNGQWVTALRFEEFTLADICKGIESRPPYF